MPADAEVVQGRATVPGQATGPVLVLDEPISIWGGIDPTSGVVVDRHHPQFGASVCDVVLVVPAGRGSSSASSVLAEMVRLGTAPAAFVLREPDEIIALGCLVAEEIYGRVTPVLVCPELPEEVVTGRTAHVDDDRLRIAPTTGGPTP